MLIGSVIVSCSLDVVASFFASFLLIQASFFNIGQTQVLSITFAVFSSVIANFISSFVYIIITISFVTFLAKLIVCVFAFSKKPPAKFTTSITFLFCSNSYTPGLAIAPFISTKTFAF